MSDRKGVTIVGEFSGPALAPTSLELLGEGRKIAGEMKQDLTALFIGSGVVEGAQQAFCYGADRVIAIDSPVYANYLTDTYVATAAKYDEAYQPEVLLFGHTALGRDMAPRLAFRLKTGLTLDCLDLKFDASTRLILKMKPVYGGNAVATYVCERGRPQMAAIRPKAMAPAAKNSERTGQVIRFDPGIDETVVRTRFLRKDAEQVTGVKLEEADVVVCGGRGLGGPEPFKQLEELAALLGGAAAASRPPCDSKWCPAHCQVGLTGKLISPTLYIGIAVSGSSQHQAGMSGSKTIVAINKDEQANIFEIAHFGVVGEFQKILPSFTLKCRELMSK